jgi:hypothetical protein
MKERSKKSKPDKRKTCLNWGPSGAITDLSHYLHYNPALLLARIAKVAVAYRRFLLTEWITHFLIFYLIPGDWGGIWPEELVVPKKKPNMHPKNPKIHPKKAHLNSASSISFWAVMGSNWNSNPQEHPFWGSTEE